MTRKSNIQIIALSVVMAGLLTLPDTGTAAVQEISQGHIRISGVVTTAKSGVLTVKTPTGYLTLNEKAARQHGHKVPKPGDEVSIVVDENNIIIEAHPKGEEGHHAFYTGTLVYMGIMKKEIKLITPEGEKVFPLGRLEVKTKPIEEGARVIIEVNEGGIVIDLHRADDDAPQTILGLNE